jgi:hypothetical protein
MKKGQQMDDLSKDMMPGKPVSARMRALIDKEKAAARKRIVERGIVHFRADREFMSALLDAAGQLRMPPGTLCRRIVWEHLQLSRQASRKYSVAPEQPLLLAESPGGSFPQSEQPLTREVGSAAPAASHASTDLAALADELRKGQAEVRDQLRELSARLPGAEPERRSGRPSGAGSAQTSRRMSDARQGRKRRP